MTREILHSDITFAQGLLEAGCEESGIATRLSLRGIEPQKAELLVRRLSHGEAVAPELPIAPTTLRRHRSGYRRGHSRHRHRTAKGHLSKTVRAVPIQSQQRHHHLKWYLSRAFAVGIGALGVVCFAYILYEAFRAIPNEPNDEYDRYVTREALHQNGLHVPPSDDLKKPVRR